MNDKHHEMILVKTHHAEWEEWRCPACERRFLIQWMPACTMIVLEPGELDIWHDLNLGDSQRDPNLAHEMDDDCLFDEFRLLPWIKWMEKVHFDRR